MEHSTAQLLTQSATEIINTLISRSWLLALVAVVIVLVNQRKSVMAFAHARSKTFKLAKPMLDPLKYTGMGLLLVYGAYAIKNFFIKLAFPTTQSATEAAEGLLATLKFHAGYSGLVFTFLIVVAGLFLIPSVGNKWMVGVSKFLLTLAVLYILCMGVIALA